MVAPSFQAYKVIVAEPFLKNGKLYITVEHPNTKNQRDVRWYTDAEYAKQYGNKSKEIAGAADIGFRGLKKARGFDQGPILLIRNWKTADESWLGHSKARYATDVGWYIVSQLKDAFLAEDYPEHFKLIPLTWEEFSKDETHPKSAFDISCIIHKKERSKSYVH